MNITKKIKANHNNTTQNMNRKQQQKTQRKTK